MTGLPSGWTRPQSGHLIPAGLPRRPFAEPERLRHWACLVQLLIEPCSQGEVGGERSGQPSFQSSCFQSRGHTCAVVCKDLHVGYLGTKHSTVLPPEG